MKYKAICYLMVWVGIMVSLPMKAQDNPYKIDEELYAYYVRCGKAVKTKQVLAMADTLFERARQKKDLKAQCLAWHIKCDHYYYVSDIPSLQEAILKARRFIEKTPYKQYVFSTWLRLITYYEGKRWYGKALAELEEFQREAVRMNNTYGISRVYRHMAQIYGMQRNYTKNLELNRKAMEYSISSNEGKDLEGLYRSMGLAYKQHLMPDSASYYYHKALEVAPDSQSKMSCYIFLSELALDFGQPDTAYSYIQKLDKLHETHPLYGLSADHYFIIKMTYYRRTEAYGKALSLCDSIKDELTQCKNRELIYKDMKDFQSAYTWQGRYALLKDSTMTDENNSLLADLTSRFDNERLSAEKNRLELRNSQLKLEQVKSQQSLLVVERERNTLQLYNQELSLKHQQSELEKINKEALYQKERAVMMETRKNQNFLLAVILAISLTVVSMLSVAYVLFRRRSYKRLEKEKEIAVEARKEAENANRLKSLFLQNVSHEVRTPLNAIVGFTELLNGEEEMDLTWEERKEMLRLISTNTDLLTTLINDVMDLSKLESNTYTLNLEEVAVSELCCAAVSAVEQYVRSGVQLRLEEPADASRLVLRTDAARLRQILINLLTNACKYTEEGSIILSYKQQDAAWVFSVTDTGCGISKAESEVIFERFEKLNSFKQGLGVGLNICRCIANLFGGRIYLDSSYTEGARFVFIHPVMPKGQGSDNQ